MVASIAPRLVDVILPPYDGGGHERLSPNEKRRGKAPAFPFVQVAVSGLLIVVEAALARLVIALAARPVGRTLVTTCRPADFAAAATAIETAASRRRTAGEVGAPIAHRAAVAAAATGASAAVTTAATAAAVTAAAAVAAATTAAAIATATAAAVAATTTASAVGRTRTARTEAAAIATATAAESAAATTTGLTFNGFADGDRSTIEQRAVHGLHGRGALIICFHLEEGEAAAAAGLAIHDHF